MTTKPDTSNRDDCTQYGQPVDGEGRQRTPSQMLRSDIWEAAGFKATDVVCTSCFAKAMRGRFGLKSQHWHDLIVEYQQKRKASLKPRNKPVNEHGQS